MPLRSTVVYPTAVIGVQIGIPSTLEMLASKPDKGLVVACVIAPGEPEDPIEPGPLAGKIAVAARISDRLNMPGGTVQATVQGLRRVRLRQVVESNGFLTARIELATEKAAPEEEARSLIARTLNALEALAAEVERIPNEVPRILRMNLGDAGRFADLVATLTNFSVTGKDGVLQLLDVQERLTFVCDEVEAQLRRVRQIAEERSNQPAKGEEEEPPTPARRAAELRQRIKMLQTELGDVDASERESVDLLRRVESAELPGKVASQARAEIERLRAVHPASPDAGEIRGYIDWLLHLPWRAGASGGPASIDLARVQEELDLAVIGLEQPKERLLDHLAVSKLRGDLRGPIPCLVGPPDVGKRSLSEAVARGLGRPLARIEMGGRGEGQLVGSRRTRLGAQPGKIIAAFRDLRVRDPVIVLSEMDEIGLGKADGDPIEAMEEILRAHTGATFVDRYLDIGFDLSHALFIALAQDFHRVPRDLRDMMFEVRIAGYTPEEKVGIARERLLPKLISGHGLDERDVEFPEYGLAFLAHGYARDSGLGALRRSLETLLRTRARARAQGDASSWTFDPEHIEEVLGIPRYVATAAESKPEIGVVTGLAWTAAGGELMFIEALRMPGSGRLIITGLLGEVMRESVNAAYSYVRSRGELLGISEQAFRESDVHVHFPVGAIPKDGPSAGVAVTLAIASTLSNRRIRHDIAMTGEVTLRGKVLEVGGIKEKVLAAHRADIRDVILPKGNERDLRDVPENVRSNIRFHFVARMDDVVQTALMDGTRTTTSKPRAKKPRKRSVKA
jgi:ATP-dependent Lon protease